MSQPRTTSKRKDHVSSTPAQTNKELDVPTKRTRKCMPANCSYLLINCHMCAQIVTSTAPTSSTPLHRAVDYEMKSTIDSQAAEIVQLRMVDCTRQCIM